MRKLTSIAVIAMAVTFLVVQPARAEAEEQILAHFGENAQVDPNIVQRPVTPANYLPWKEKSWFGEDPRLQWCVWFREGSTIGVAVRQELPRIIDPPQLRKKDLPHEQVAPPGRPEGQELIYLLYRQFRLVEIVLADEA